ncbi:MAG: hypothetical protein AAF944_26680 [Bacteroidota bacterium]
MRNFNIIGRPDGLGNRIEEVILVHAYCSKKNQKANYIWQNKHKQRTYSVKFTCKNLKISDTIEIDIPFKKTSDLQLNIGQDEILKFAKDIVPSFNIRFESDIKPIGIHIRGTDRILNNGHPHFMKDRKELFSYLSKTLELVNSIRPKYLFICSDDDKIRKIFIDNLDSKIVIVEPVYDKDVSAEYIDFFALTLCEKTVMCSKFSSFAITASLIANSPIVTFSYDEDVARRYQALFQYQPNISYNKDLYSLYSSTISDKLKAVKQRLLTMCKNALKRILH